ncbi:MAG: UDP-N-acetylmuramate--L-alanine ligase [Chitinophagaceae bacterium]|nr:UDP-N-acetylmuramate--L-alanine ligase [Chitinophagaceae bacterium]
MNLTTIHSIYFIGIGGIGMSGLARYFHANGYRISGYDKTPSALTAEMSKEGMQIHFEEDLSLIPKDVDLVVYTPAIPADHKELLYYREHNFTIIKRADLLEELTKDMITIAVAGTHGKTTTSSMIAHIFKSSGYDCTAFLGGITANYRTNFLAGKNNIVVVEADEFDRSFLKLHPNIAVITSCDPDHLDIYGTKEEVQQSYQLFAKKIKNHGTLFTKRNLSFLSRSDENVSTVYYGLEESKGDIHAVNARLENGTYAFDFVSKTARINNIHLSIAGRHNAENAIAAAAVTSLFEIDRDEIRSALHSFKGVQRRFQFIVRNKMVVYIDDYAHHPVEITAFLQSVREIFPGKKITCIFQPHLFTRTRDFAEGFGQSLSLADEVMLLPVYPARELPIEGVNSEMLIDKITSVEKCVVEKNDLLQQLSKSKLEVLVTVGAGDIDQFVEPIAKMLKEKEMV